MRAKHKKPIGPSAKPIPKVISFQDPLPEPQRYRPEADRTLSRLRARIHALELAAIWGKSSRRDCLLMSEKCLNGCECLLRTFLLRHVSKLRKQSESGIWQLSRKVAGITRGNHFVLLTPQQ